MNEMIIGPSIKYKLPEMLWALPEFLFRYIKKSHFLALQILRRKCRSEIKNVFTLCPHIVFVQNTGYIPLMHFPHNFHIARGIHWSIHNNNNTFLGFTQVSVKIVFKLYNPNFGMNYLNQFACVLSHSVIATPWTIAYQVPLSMGFFRKEYWSGLPFSSPGDLPDPGIEHRSPILQVDYLPSELPGKPSIYSYANRMAISTLQGWNEVCIINPKEWIHLDHLIYTVVTVWL